MNIHPTEILPRLQKENLLKQKGIVIWFFGLSGSGKSTIANAVEKVLHKKGHFSIRLDGDNLRTGLNRDLGFSENGRLENLRRAAEVAKIMADNGAIVLCSFITPLGEFRDMLRGILGEDYRGVYVKASYETCAGRDTKGLYAKAERGEVEQFTGLTSDFEEPTDAHLVLDTEELGIMDAAIAVLDYLHDQEITHRPDLG